MNMISNQQIDLITTFLCNSEVDQINMSVFHTHTHTHTHTHNEQSDNDTDKLVKE